MILDGAMLSDARAIILQNANAAEPALLISSHRRRHEHRTRRPPRPRTALHITRTAEETTIFADTAR